jgi:hypothetical protein
MPKAKEQASSQETEAQIKGKRATLVQETVHVTPDPPGNRGLGVPLSGQEGTVEIKAEVSALLEYIRSTPSGLPLQFGMGTLVGPNAGIHTLPTYIDELERDFGTDMYLRLLNDAAVKAADGVLRDSILDKPITLSLGIDEKTDKAKEAKKKAKGVAEPGMTPGLPGAPPPVPEETAQRSSRKKKLAEKVLEFCEAALDHIDGDVMTLAREMLEGIPLGYKLAELVYEVADLRLDQKAGKQLVVKKVKTKPHEAVSFVSNHYNDIMGYLPRDLNTGLLASLQPNDAGEVPGMLPEAKVLRFTWNPRNGDPRGTSNLRAAYVPWRLKIGLYPAYEAYLARFAQPATALELDGAPLPPMTDAAGETTTDPAVVTTLLLTSLRNFAGGGAMVVPVGKVNMLEAAKGGEVYLQAFTLVNTEITKAILHQELATNEAQFGTRAQSEVHQDVMGMQVALGKAVLADMFRYQLLARMVEYNYGPEALEVLPRVTFGETEQQDLSTVASAAVSFVTNQMIVPSQYNEVLEMVHFPQIPQDTVDMMMEAFTAKLEASIVQSQQATMMPPPGMEGMPPASPSAPPGAAPGGVPQGAPGTQPPGAMGGAGEQVPQEGPPGRPSWRPFRGEEADEEEGRAPRLGPR